MALITSGSLHDFSVTANKQILQQKTFLKSFSTFSALKEVSRSLESNSFELITSADPRGLALKSLTLSEGFEGILGGLLNPTNEVYFMAWAWDLSGQPVVLYPGEGTDPESVLIPVKVGKLREFIGQGVNLFPKRKVRGGIAIRLQLWESDQDVRNLGKVLTETADTIQKSELNSLLSTISMVTGVSGATVSLIENASIELAKLIGTILKANSNDYVDLFEGYYASDAIWTAGEDTYKGNASQIVLTKY